MFFNKVTIIGVGLIGGSLAIELKKHKLAGSVVGVGRGIKNLETAKRLGIVDSFTTDLKEGVTGADLVVLAMPVMSTGRVMKDAAPHMKKGAVVTDVGSVKESVILEVEPLTPAGVLFVPGHPIAGTEHSGAEAAFEGLFKDRRTILTPTGKTDKAALAMVRRMWEMTGSKVIEMDAKTHDKILASISHLPHVIAYSLVNAVVEADGGGLEILKYSAGGFKDFTRIASSSPEMWRDICAMNKDAVLSVLAEFEKKLASVRSMIEKGDNEALKEEFGRAKAARDSIIKNP